MLPKALSNSCSAKVRTVPVTFELVLLISSAIARSHLLGLHIPAKRRNNTAFTVTSWASVWLLAPSVTECSKLLVELE